MDVNGLTGLVSSVGFPIMCCIAMGWFITAKLDKFTEAIQNMVLELQKLQDEEK